MKLDSQPVIGFTVISAFVGMILLMMLKPPPADSALMNTLTTLIGSLGAMAGMVVTYYFGSSRGSTAKDETIASLANSAPVTDAAPAKAPAPTAAPQSAGPAPRAAPVAIALVLAVGALLALAAPALAQEGKRIGGAAGAVLDRAGVRPLGAPQAAGSDERSGISAASDRGGLGEAIERITLEDLRAAIALAELPTGPGGQPDEVAKQCYSALLTYIELKAQLRAEQAGDDKGRLIAKFQRSRNLVRMLDTDSPVRRACAAFAADVKQDVRSLIGGLVSGLALKALVIP